MSCNEQTERFKTKIYTHQDAGSPVMVNCIEQRAFLPQGVNGDGLAETKAGTQQLRTHSCSQEKVCKLLIPF